MWTDLSNDLWYDEAEIYLDAIRDHFGNLVNMRTVFLIKCCFNC